LTTHRLAGDSLGVVSNLDVQAGPVQNSFPKKKGDWCGRMSHSVLIAGKNKSGGEPVQKIRQSLRRDRHLRNGKKKPDYNNKNNLKNKKGKKIEVRRVHGGEKCLGGATRGTGSIGIKTGEEDFSIISQG